MSVQEKEEKRYEQTNKRVICVLLILRILQLKVKNFSFF